MMSDLLATVSLARSALVECNDALIQAIVAAGRAGVPVTNIAQSSQLSYATVRTYLVSEGVIIPKRGPSSFALSCRPNSRKQEIIERALSGENRSDIAKDVGLSIERVRQIAMSAGEPPRTTLSPGSKSKQRAAIRVAQRANPALRKRAFKVRRKRKVLA